MMGSENLVADERISSSSYWRWAVSRKGGDGVKNFMRPTIFLAFIHEMQTLWCYLTEASS